MSTSFPQGPTKPWLTVSTQLDLTFKSYAMLKHEIGHVIWENLKNSKEAADFASTVRRELMVGKNISKYTAFVWSYNNSHFDTECFAESCRHEEKLKSISPAIYAAYLALLTKF